MLLSKTSKFLPLRMLSQVGKQIHTSSVSSAELMVKGKLLNYEKVGEGPNIVLCLPGAIGTIQSDFGPQLEGLSHEKFQLIAWDPPGYGKSRPPAREFPLNYLNQDADMAAAFMEGLGYDKYSLLGWSDGGITAMMLTAAFPERVEKLVQWGGNAYVHEGDIKVFEGLRDIEKWSPRMRAPMEATYGKEYFKTLWEGYIDAYAAVYYKNEGDFCKKDLAKIRCPTLIVHGAKDPLVGMEHAQYLHEHIANSQLLVMPEGKHNLHLKYAKEFNDIVTKFLLKDE